MYFILTHWCFPLNYILFSANIEPLVSPSHRIVVPGNFIYHMPKYAEEPAGRLCVSTLKTAALKKRQPVLEDFEQPALVSWMTIVYAGLDALYNTVALSGVCFCGFECALNSWYTRFILHGFVMQPASSWHSAHTHYAPSARIYYSSIFLFRREGVQKQVNQPEKWTQEKRSKAAERNQDKKWWLKYNRRKNWMNGKKSMREAGIWREVESQTISEKSTTEATFF